MIEKSGQSIITSDDVTIFSFALGDEVEVLLEKFAEKHDDVYFHHKIPVELEDDLTAIVLDANNDPAYIPRIRRLTNDPLYYEKGFDVPYEFYIDTSDDSFTPGCAYYLHVKTVGNVLAKYKLSLVEG